MLACMAYACIACYQYDLHGLVKRILFKRYSFNKQTLLSLLLEQSRVLTMRVTLASHISADSGLAHHKHRETDY